jgi:O-antigen/teichoic acid export membrane protein
VIRSAASAGEGASAEVAVSAGAGEVKLPAGAVGEGAASSHVHRAGGSHAHSIWRRVRRDVVLLAAGNFGVVLAQLAFRSILIAVLLPAAYGRLSLILSIYNTVWVIGTSGLPNSVARHIALVAPANDSPIVRSALRASAWPTLVAASVVASVSGILLHAPLAFVLAAVGLSSLVYSLLAMGILRGRGRIGAAASIMPIAALGEVALLAALWRSGWGVTPLSAFAAFCAGNVIGLVAAVVLVRRSASPWAAIDPPAEQVPSPRALLGFSMWLAAATIGISSLPLVVRSAAALDSYTVVAIVDVALVLLTVPQRMAAAIVAAVIPHATRALGEGNLDMTISRREHLMVVVPFVLAAALLAFTPIVGLLFDALGRPQYEKSSVYLALALLASPARLLYGVVEGVLVAHGESRFLALNALAITAIATVAILASVALGSIVAAFTAFVVAFWAVYLCGRVRLTRIMRLASADYEPAAPAEA